MKYDFGGWATKYDTHCSDGRQINKEAFKHQDGQTIPLVWNHSYSGPESVIGHAVLRHNEEGVYAYCRFNESETASNAKTLVKHGDITSLSIYANKLQQTGNRVLHGEIREVSLVLAGANPGACIQEVMIHGGISEDEATIFNDETELDLEITHAAEGQNDEPETVADVYNTLTDKQKKAVAVIFDQLADSEESDEDEKKEDEKKEEDSEMKHNVFEKTPGGEKEIKHSEFMRVSIEDAKKYGSLKESCLAHAATYGITNIGELFPNEVNVNNEPIFIDRDQTWVGEFLNGTKKSPFSRLKALMADITEDDARARGYIKGNLKKEEVFHLLKRTTSPTTIYKKQKLDRDDIVDITDFSVVDWMKREMRGKLDEEIARAMLVGDGRSSVSEDKVKESCIRPIYNDDDLYTIKALVGTGEVGKAFIKAVIRAMADYEGKGIPNLYTTNTMITEMKLIEDTTGRTIYENLDTLATVLGVKKIVPVPVMKGLTRDAGSGVVNDVLAVIVNPSDYTVGADKGGQIGMFDDFDIDYNQYKYLMETRCSGSLLAPKTAITIEKRRA